MVGLATYPRGVRLYHYTSSTHLQLILGAKVLRTTESNVSLNAGEERAGPDAVWLTSEADPTGYGHGLDGSSVNKREIRITVEVEDARLWRLWAPEQGMSRVHMKRLARTGGGGERTWYVVQRPIPMSDWVEVSKTATGEVLLDRGVLAAAAEQRSPFERG